MARRLKPNEAEVFRRDAETERRFTTLDKLDESDLLQRHGQEDDVESVDSRLLRLKRSSQGTTGS